MKMEYAVNSMQNPPKFEGEYLFYFGKVARPFFAVDTMRFTDDSDVYDPCQWYLENNMADPTLWFELPKIADGTHA